MLVKIGDDRPSEPLSLEKVAIEAVVNGFLAETTMTMTFRSGHDRVLEGELVFPLPEGATVTGYALDVNGEMVDGVVVERHEARIAFEKEVRKGVDPGLVEWVQGNNYRTRVFPIPPRGTRTVRVQYVSDLVTQQGAALYHLPLRFSRPVSDLSLKVEVVKGFAKPEVREGGPASFRFETWEERYVAQAKLKDARPDQDLLIALPAVPQQSARVERDEAGEFYFVIDDFPRLSPVAAAHPKRIGIAWDATLSRQAADLKRELGLLEALLKRLGDVEVSLVVFRNEPEAPRSFAVKAGDATPLLEHLRGIAFDGGTALGRLALTKDCAYWLLLSDGLGNLGDDVPAAIAAPVYAVASDPQANHALLRYLAETSGGAYFNLARTSDEQALATLGAQPFSFVSAEGDPGAVTDLLPGHRQPVLGRFTLSGRLVKPTAHLTLRYSDGQSRGFDLAQAGAARTGLVPRFWAQQKVSELSVFPERNHDELLRLGRRFSLVTPGTSLLVLETVEQYLEHRITPPKSRRRVYEEYLKRTAERDAAEKKVKEAKVARVLEMWERRLRWWETEFKYDPQALKQRPKVTADGEPRPEGMAESLEAPARAHEESRRDSRVGAMPPPAPAAAMPAPSTVPAESKAKKEVTGEDESRSATIEIQPWNPDTPYLRAMQAAGKDAYAAYLSQRKSHGGSPAFFLDCADHLFQKGQRALAVRVLTNVVELGLDEPQLLRIAAHKLEQEGELDLAVDLFEKVLRLRPEEPQSPRDLALALQARADARRAKSGAIDRATANEYLRSISLLNDLVLGEWDARFPEIEVIALEDANRMMALLEGQKGLGALGSPVDPRLRKPLDLDVRIVLTWDTDMTDMDLWVIEPSGEKCFYSHNLTSIGGTISRDFTRGYGPEEYLVRHALKGEYQVKANFYGSSAQRLTGPTTVQATVITHFGRPNEQRRSLTLRLTERKEVVDVGTIRFE